VLRRPRAGRRLPDLERDRHADRGRPRVRARAPLMYALIAGGGKVGSNLARTLIRAGHEVTLIEQREGRFDTLESELEHQVHKGDATELFTLERAGIERPPDIVVA